MMLQRFGETMPVRAVKFAPLDLKQVEADGTFSGDADYAPLSHGHAISDVTGLQTALDGKVNLSGATFTGQVLINSSSPPQLDVIGDGLAASARLSRYQSNSLGPINIGHKARGSLASPSATNANDQLLRFVARAYNGTAFEDAAEFNSIVINTNVTGSGNHPSGSWDFLSPSSTNTSTLNCDQLNARFDYDGAVYFPAIGTTGSAANAFLNSGSTPANQLLRSTSSVRFKADIEPIEPERVEAFFAAVSPIWFHSLAKADKLPDGKQKSFYSFGAEALAEIDPRLVTWGYFADDYDYVEDGEGEDKTRTRRLKEGAAPKPDGVNDRAIIAMLVAEVKRLRDEVETLKQGL
jgi:hypothetical protein